MNSISLIRRTQQYLEKKGSFYFSRKKAHRLRRQIINERGYTIVNRKKKKALKSYAKKTFGSSSFWPWLSLYTELRGEFKMGWIPEDYYTFYILKKYNPESIRMSDYKTFDNKIFPDFALEPLIIKIGENFYDSSRQQITTEKARNIVFNYNNEVVIKEDLSSGGNRVKFINSREFKPDVYTYISSYIVQPVIQQHENLKLLNDKAVSTVRVVTYLNKKGNIEVKYAFLRFGLGDSRVDNVSSGGGFSFINSDGSLEGTAYNKLGIDMGIKHPNSGILYKSVKIPGYENILNTCVKHHNAFPYAKLIGWDVAVKETGEPILLEWNLRPLMGIMEALQGPLFKDENP